MDDQRLAWYRQRAEEEGEHATYWVMLHTRMRIQDRDDIMVNAVREAAHYGNLVLGPEPLTWPWKAYGVLTPPTPPERTR